MVQKESCLNSDRENEFSRNDFLNRNTNELLDHQNLTENKLELHNNNLKYKAVVKSTNFVFWILSEFLLINL